MSSISGGSRWKVFSFKKIAMSVGSSCSSNRIWQKGWGGVKGEGWFTLNVIELRNTEMSWPLKGINSLTECENKSHDNNLVTIK